MTRTPDLAAAYRFLAKQERLVAALCRMHGEDADAERLDERAREDDQKAVSHTLIPAVRMAAP